MVSYWIVILYTTTTITHNAEHSQVHSAIKMGEYSVPGSFLQKINKNMSDELIIPTRALLKVLSFDASRGDTSSQKKRNLLQIKAFKTNMIHLYAVGVNGSSHKTFKVPL